MGATPFNHVLSVDIALPAHQRALCNFLVINKPVWNATITTRSSKQSLNE